MLARLHNVDLNTAAAAIGAIEELIGVDDVDEALVLGRGMRADGELVRIDARAELWSEHLAIKKAINADDVVCDMLQVATRMHD